MHLSPSRIAKLFPRAPADHVPALAERSAELLDRYRIARTPARLNFFLAMIGLESNGLADLEEELAHSAVRLTQLFPWHFATVAAARPAGRHPAFLAERLYGGQLGNGPEGAGDGWRYRSRGYLRLSGRDTYAAVAEAADLDLVGEPDLVTAPATALQAACALWSWRGLNAVADTGSLDKAARRLRGGSEAIGDAEAWLAKIRRVLAEPDDEAGGLLGIAA